MSIDRRKYVLAFARGFHIASKEVGNLAEQDGVWTYKPGPYTIENDTCDCEAFVSNMFHDAAEKQGQEVGAYPGLTCKHVLGIALFEGRLELADLGELSPDDYLSLKGGFADQAAQIKRRDTEFVAGEVTGHKDTERVSVIRVTALAGYHLKLGGGRKRQTWAFGLNGLDKDEAIAKAKERFPEGFTITVESATADWAETIQPIA